MTPLLLLVAAHAGPLEEVLVDELSRAMNVLDEQAEPPHYVAITVEDHEDTQLTAREGTVARRDVSERSRYLDVDLRVGTADLDSTHPLRGFSALDDEGRRRLRVALDDTAAEGRGDGFALRHALRLELDRAYRDAAERIVILRANQSVKVEEEDPAPDFEPRKPVSAHEEVPALALDEAEWSTLLLTVSKRLDASPVVHRSVVDVSAQRVVKTFVDTEGARLVHGRLHARLTLQAETTAQDGDVVQVFRALDVHDPGDLPSEEEVLAWAEEAVERVEALAVAPRGEPYSGPVLLQGRAAGVFFHEVFGHRVEGHRQKRDDEGKTFADHVGKPILPEWIDVVDDPTVASRAGEDLNGHYSFDDEGVPGQPARLVDDGVFVGFLMGRSPIQGFPTSNGHGRRSPGNLPKARMGNTLVEASDTVSEARLKELLVQELKAQDLPYGYIVEQIDGGFTMTGRVMPNAFNVRASASWRVYADGRPDELVRGIDLVGTPFAAFSNLIAASDQEQVFNGTCGAESGWVPVSAVAPSILFRKLEFQLKEKGSERPPLRAKPTLTVGEDT